MDLSVYLEHANKAMAVVTVFLVQLVKLILPSPAPEAVGEKPNRWAVIPQLKWFPVMMAFVLGTVLSSLMTVLAPGRCEVFALVGGGLETGALAVAFWEVYSNVVRPAAEGLFRKG